MSLQKNGYVEVTSPQLLDDKWQEFTFDLASGQNVFQDIVMPEIGSGYVYRDAKQLGSATHNRFIYWRTANDFIELVEVSTEVQLEDNQIRIRFVNSPIINNVNVIELSDSVVVVIATIASVHRLYLPHPKTTNKSVLADLTSDVIFNSSNYFLISQNGSTSSQQPISASSWFDKSNIKCALSLPDSSLLIVQFGHQTHQITTSIVKQTGIIGRLWSKMPNLWAKSPDECDNAVFSSAPLEIPEANDVILFTLCRDCRVRVFSTNTKECICSYNMVPQASFHQSFSSQVNPSCEIPMLKIFGSQVVIYLSEEFILLEYSYQEGIHELREAVKVPAPSWEQVVDFALTQDKIWALGISDTESTLCYMELETITPDTQHDASMMIENQWYSVNLPDEPARSLVVEIFWSNRFSAETVRKALVGLAGPHVPSVTNMVDLEEFASTHIIESNRDEQWSKFHNYCLQNHQRSNKNIGLIAADDGSVVSIIKRSNPAFVCPWLLESGEDAPYRGISLPLNMSDILKDLNKISRNVDENLANLFEQRLFDDPAHIMAATDEIIQHLKCKNWFRTISDNLIPTVEYICECLDLTDQARDFNQKILNDCSTQLRSAHNPLGSYSGIIITYEMFKLFVRARMTLARDLLFYISLLQMIPTNDKANIQMNKCEELFTSGTIKRLLDCLRSYGVLVWIAETPIKHNSQLVEPDVINFLSRYFDFFKTSRDFSNKSQDSAIERTLHQNLFMSFLAAGGVNYSFLLSEISHDQQTLSNSLYVSKTAENLCKLLWPRSGNLCLPEFMFTQQIDEPLAKYLDLLKDWLDDNEDDRHFIRAANCILQNRATQSVEIFNRLWMRIKPGNMLYRFLDLNDAIATSENHILNSDLIYQYYEKLIQLFQTHNNRQCLVMLINHCMSLIDEKSDCDQQNRINCLRAKLFQFYLELEDFDEAYHTMVLTTDSSLRFNCLRRFIVSHCEKEQWMNLLSYPFIDIRNDFLEILNQKAESLDLSTLDEKGFYKTTYYDLLFASHVSDDNYKGAAEIMYNYAQRLSQEVPGITSIKKQTDCLLIALNTLRCVDDKEKYLEFKSTPQRERIRTSILKRSHDCESDSQANLHSGDSSQTSVRCNRIYCEDIEQKYELTRARLRLLEQDRTGNAIALSPLTSEEIIAQLVSASMFSIAMDLALLFNASMEPILDGLTSKYILIMRFSSVDAAVHQDIERGLCDTFTSSYSNIETYNYVASSTSPLVERVWRLINHYLVTYDGVSHTYRTTEFANSFASATVLMRVVANKLLSSGFDVPASLRRQYLSRNTSELLKLFMKYDKLLEAAELATEMVNRTLEPANCLPLSSAYGTSKPCPLYIPTHLMLLIISYLNEDATNIQHIKTANELTEKLDKFRNFVKLN